MQKNNTVSFIRKNEKYLAFALIVFGALLRVLAVGSFPAGLNQDEASAGYEAWSVLTSGFDRNGVSLPVLFISWGSGQNVLYSYLSMPFIAVFGLNVTSFRLVAAICGTISLPLFYGLAKKLRGGLFGLAALAVLVINPWHIMISRWALESNLFPFMLLLGTYLLAAAEKKPWKLVFSAAVFALSLYSYGTAFIFLPFYLACLFIFMLKNKFLRPKQTLVSAAVFIVIALPIALCNAINILGLSEMKLFGLSLPILTETRQTATTVFGGGSLLSNVKNLLSILWKQSDGLAWNSIPVFGLFWGIPGLLFAISGVVFSISEIKNNKNELIVVFALAAALLSAALIDVNVNRINMIFLPIIYFQAVGLYFCLRYLGSASAIPAAACICILAVVFCRSYFGPYQDTVGRYFFSGLGSAIEYAGDTDADHIWITDSVNAPYIYVLFYEQIPQDEFNSTVAYADENAPFRTVTSFGRYVFGGSAPESGTVFIMTSEEAQLVPGLRTEACFGDFVVAEKN